MLEHYHTEEEETRGNGHLVLQKNTQNVMEGTFYRRFKENANKISYLESDSES